MTTDNTQCDVNSTGYCETHGREYHKCQSNTQELGEILGQAFYIEDGEYIGSYQEGYPIGFDIKQAILDWHNRQVAEALETEHRILQHQAFNVLKSAKAVGQWSELRINYLKES